MTEEHKNKISKALKGKPKSENHKRLAGFRSGLARKGRPGSWIGKKHSEETKIKISQAKLGQNTGQNHWNWLGGLWNDPYPKEFNSVLKLKIRTKYNFVCCLCGKTEREELEELNRVLCVNHIDFNKSNCEENNLNVLCIRCNIKINRNREYWTEFFNQSNK